MNSQTLKESGFSDPCLLKSISFSNLPLNKSSVFAIIDTTLTGKAPSDILYIGRSKRPARRVLGGYLGGYGGKTTRKINTNLFDEGFIEKASITWMLSDKPKAKQKELIDKFVQEHGESPVWNASKKKPIKVPQKAVLLEKSRTKTEVPAKAAKQQPAKRGRPTVKPAAPAKTSAPAKMTPPAKPTEPSTPTPSMMSEEKKSVP